MPSFACPALPILPIGAAIARDRRLDHTNLNIQSLHLVMNRGALKLDADEAVIRKEGDELIIRPIKRPQGLTALLAAWEPEINEFPHISDSPAEPEDIF